MTKHEILFKNFDLEKHEQVWNEMIYHIIEAHRYHQELRGILKLLPHSERIKTKQLAPAWIKGRFAQMVDRLLSTALRFHGSLESMIIKKEKRNG